MGEGFLRRLGWGASQRLRSCWWYCHSWAVGRGSCRAGLLGHKLRWPLPWSAPSHRAEVTLVRAGGLGDVLMCTPALRRLKEINPSCRVIFLTRHRELLERLPFLDEVHDHTGPPRRGAIVLRYENGLPTRRHIAQLLGDCLGVRVNDVRPSCAARGELVARYRREWARLPRPVVVLNRRASEWTPNKDWPAENWDELIGRLARRASVVEVGVSSSGPAHPGVAVDLCGRTGVGELVAALAAADLHVGPVSGPMHIAAAVGTPAVVIYGGFEHPGNSGYRGNVNLYSPVPCAPCWLKTDCPHQRMCLSRITPAVVERWLWRRWEAADPTRRAEAARA